MNNVVRLFSIIIFILLIPTCLANAIEDEERELNLTLLRPIIDHFSESNSYSKIMSNKILEHEIATKTQLNRAQVAILKKQILKEHPFTDDTLRCIHKTVHRIKGKTLSEEIAKSYLNVWLMKSVKCSDYAELVLIAFEFNRMNNIIIGRPLHFKTAVLIIANTDTGDHSFVLVEGNSGAVFAVDPWARRVTRLYPNFIKLSNIADKIYKLGDNDNYQLNLLFGQPYYDVRYVNYDTKWLLKEEHSQLIRDISLKRNDYMQILYETLQPSFPQWELGYKPLLIQTHHIINKVHLEEEKHK